MGGRGDSFAGMSDEIRELVRAHPGLKAKTLFEASKRKYPGEFTDGQRRTLQRPRNTGER